MRSFALRKASRIRDGRFLAALALGWAMLVPMAFGQVGGQGPIDIGGGGGGGIPGGGAPGGGGFGGAGRTGSTFSGGSSSGGSTGLGGGGSSLGGGGFGASSGSGGGASNGMFGMRNLGGGVNAGQRGFSSNRMQNGMLQGNERFLKNSRRGQFVGADSNDMSSILGGAMAGMNNRGRNNMLGNRNGNLNNLFNNNNQDRQRKAMHTRTSIGFEPGGVSNPQLSATLARRLNKPNHLKMLSPVEVEVQGATAVLRGVVATDHDRALAEQVALLEAGIGQVQNELVLPTELPADSLPVPPSAGPRDF